MCTGSLIDARNRTECKAEMEMSRARLWKLRMRAALRESLYGLSLAAHNCIIATSQLHTACVYYAPSLWVTSPAWLGWVHDFHPI